MKRIVTVAVALIATASMAQTVHVWEDPGGWWGGHFVTVAEAPKFTAQELSLDLFGSYLNPEGKFNDLFNTSMNHGYWGGGAGLNYFMTRELGLGVDFNMSSKPDDLRLEDQVTGDLILRLPFGNSGFAPYLIGSGGRGMSPQWEWVYGGGVGVEMRFNPTTGIFSDARFFWNDKTTDDNRLVIRAGLRIVF
jgi:hypothetical protein